MSDYPLSPGAVIGFGVVSTFGVGTQAIWRGLLDGRSALGPLPERLQAPSRCEAAAVVDVDLVDAKRRCQQRLSGSSLMTPVGAPEAHSSHAVDVDLARIGVVVVNGIGNLDLLDAAWCQADRRLSPALAFQGYAHAGACEGSRELGAGGSVLEALPAALTLKHGQCSPTPNCPELDPACGDLALVPEPTPLSIRHVPTHDIGFGGYYLAAQVCSRGR